MAQEIYRNQILLMKAETVPGTLETFAGANAIPCELMTPTPQAEAVERSTIIPIVPGLPYVSQMAQKKLELPIVCEFAGSGAAGTAPAFDLLLLAGGFNKAVVATTSVTYSLPWPHPTARYSSAFNLDGQQFASRGGIISSLRLSGEAGGIMRLEATSSGTYVDVAAVTALSPVYPTFATPPVFDSTGVGSVTLAGVSVCVSSFNVAIENTIAYQDLGGGGCAAPRYDVTDRTVSGSITIRNPELSVLNMFDRSMKSITGNLILPYGVTAGNICTINQPNVQFTEPSISETEGIMYLTVNYTQRATSLNQQLNFVFT